MSYWISSLCFSVANQQQIEAPDVGPLRKIRIGHDGKGVGSGWYLESIKIQRYIARAKKRKKKRRELKKQVLSRTFS